MDKDNMIQSFSPLEINQEGGHSVEVYHGIPYAAKNNYRLPGFERLYASGGYGSMCFFHFAGKGFDIWYSNYALTGPATFMAKGNFSALELHIPFNSQFMSWWDGQKEHIVRDKQFGLSYFPFINSHSKFPCKNTYNTFDIHYSPGYLKKFSAHSPSLSTFLERVEKGEQAELVASPQFLSPTMAGLVNGMLQCDMSPSMAEYFYESCAQLMLIEVLGRLNGPNSGGEMKYSAFDIERAIAAKEIIVSDMSIKYSISDLARATGFNEWKLQHTFKHLFGSTIFDYSQSVRLNHAKQLLFATSDPIHIIAVQCGYPDHPNLTAAFKKKFGYTPDRFRAQKK